MKRLRMNLLGMIIVGTVLMWPSSAGGWKTPTLVADEVAYPDSTPVIRDLGTFRVTNYSVRGVMRNGDYTHPGAVAVDPRVIPLGTRLLIEGFGDIVFTAEDTGGGVIGPWIDIYRTSHRDAVDFGMQYLRVQELDQ